MMKKVLALMLVLGMTSLASATVIDVVTVGTGDLGHAGTSTDPLHPSETIEIAIILNYNPYPGGWTSYDGYVMDGMDLDLHVTGPGSLEVPGLYNAKFGFRYGDDLQHHVDFGVWSQSGSNDGTEEGYVPLIAGNAIASMSGGVLTGVIAGDENGNPPTSPTVLVWNLFLHCEDYGPVNLDLTLAGSTRIADYTDATGNGPYPDWRYAVEGELGDLVIHQIPEPMTIALLGLGGLFLRRRR
jgi:hypothetical protein